MSFADTKARIMGKKGRFDYAYNTQISVDADMQIIVGLHISQNANDKQELEPALKALQGTVGRLPDHLSAEMATSLAIIYRPWSKAAPIRSVPIAHCKAAAANPQKEKPVPSVPMTKHPCVNS